MTDVLSRTEDLTVNGINVASLCRDMSWAVDFELIDGERPFGPDRTRVAVREIHSGGVVYGFLVETGMPGEISYLAISEVDGDKEWHQVGEKIVWTEGEDLDGMLDTAGRDIIADSLMRGHLAKANA